MAKNTWRCTSSTMRLHDLLLHSYTKVLLPYDTGQKKNVSSIGVGARVCVACVSYRILAFYTR